MEHTSEKKCNCPSHSTSKGEVGGENGIDGGEIRENFCPSCLAIPLAMAGVGASAIGANKKGAYKTQKKILFWSGIATILLAIFIIVYFTFIKKCSDCR